MSSTASNPSLGRLEDFCTKAGSTIVLSSIGMQDAYLGNMTPCFEDLVILGVVHFTMFICSVVYMRALMKSGTVKKTKTAVHVTAIRSICSLYNFVVPLVLLLVENDESGGVPPYQIIAVALSMLAWLCYMGAMAADVSKFSSGHVWILRFVTLFSFIANLIKIDTVQVLADFHDRAFLVPLYVLGICTQAALVADACLVRRTEGSQERSTEEFQGEVSVQDAAASASESPSGEGPASSDATTAKPEGVDIALEEKTSKEGVVLNPKRFESKLWPELKSNILSRLTFWWLNPLCWLGFKRPLQMSDMWQLDPVDKCSSITPIFQAAWADQVSEGTFSLFAALKTAFGRTFFLAAFPKLFNDGAQFAGPLLMSRLISWTASDRGMTEGYVIAVGMFLFAILGAVGENYYFNIVMRVGMHARTSLITALYRKSMKLSPEAKTRVNSGKLVNLMENDTTRLMMLCTNGHLLWSSPLRVIVSLVLLFSAIGPSAAAGVAVLLLMIPIQGKLAKKMQAIRKQVLQRADKRLNLTTEAISGIKIIKFYAWEQSFVDKVEEIRSEEMNLLLKNALVNAGNIVVVNAGPVIVALATFVTFGMIEQYGNGPALTADKAFTTLSLLNVLRYPLIFFPSVLSSVLDGRVSLQRIADVLKESESEDDDPSRETGAPNHHITIRDGSFTWGGEGSLPSMQGVNVNIATGELVAVVGTTGSGKSSLVSAIIGEMRMVDGEVELHGSLAYVPQHSWVFNDTLRNNIVFSDPNFNAERYQDAIQGAALVRDIELLPGGDLTELGERGSNLSGGQRQRVSLARALYADADVYLFDDPLSALDAKVGRYVFEKSIQGRLAGKTRLLVTNQLQFVPSCDKVIVIEDGKLIEQGNVKDLMADSSSVLYDMMRSVSGGDDDESKARADADAQKAEKEKAGKDDKEADPRLKVKVRKAKGQADGSVLMTKEERDTGSIGFDLYIKYAMNAGGKGVALAVCILYTILQVFRAMTSWWLSFWSSNGEEYSIGFFLGIYAAFSVGMALVQLWATIVFAKGSVKASRTFHSTMFKAVLRAPMAWFDQTPLGRIQNRFSKDIAAIDNMLPMMLQMFVRSAFELASVVIVIGVTLPYFLVACVPALLTFYWIQAFFRATSREIKRLDAITRSPIYANFSETIAGTAVISAFGKRQAMSEQNANRVDYNQRAYWAGACANRWLSIRLEFVGAMLVFSAALFAVLGRDALGKDAPGLTGLAISYSLSITALLNLVVRVFTETENAFNSVQRVLFYSNLESEAPAIVDDNRPPEDWPQQGQITFGNVEMRYRKGLPLVLKGMSVDVKPGEKVGVVGRTGAGKSTLFLSLFRMCELDGGSITVDGLDIRKLGLNDLRSRLAIIPQEPVLFKGTVRFNLDPFNQFDVAKLSSVLDRVHMTKAITAMGGLNAEISQGGENISVGQRQLLCIARAILKNARIVIADEATANVDNATDSLIQNVIRSEFKNATTLTIAHRLLTIIDSDKVLVLDAGKVAQYDSPKTLLEDEDGIFAGLVRDTGPQTSSKLRSIAFGEESPEYADMDVGDLARAVSEVPVTQDGKKGSQTAASEDAASTNPVGALMTATKLVLNALTGIWNPPARVSDREEEGLSSPSAANVSNADWSAAIADVRGRLESTLHDQAADKERNVRTRRQSVLGEAISETSVAHTGDNV